MKKKSNKLAKLERNRYSVFHDGNLCYICNSNYQLTWHELFEGTNRRNSMKYGFCLRLCLNCHRMINNDYEFINIWKKKSQNYFENNIGSKEDFISIFHKNYLD